MRNVINEGAENRGRADRSFEGDCARVLEAIAAGLDDEAVCYMLDAQHLSRENISAYREVRRIALERRPLRAEAQDEEDQE